MRRHRPRSARVVAATLFTLGLTAAVQWAPRASASAPRLLSDGLIQHVVVIYQENHSFDEVLGAYCTRRPTPCDGFTGRVRLQNKHVVQETVSPDIVPTVSHTTESQALIVNDGKMNKWNLSPGCSAPDYLCLTYYRPNQIPSLVALANHFAVSDRTFSLALSPSWGGHLYAAAAELDGFNGDKPVSTPGVPQGPGWGCDSNMLALWTNPDGVTSRQPACVPATDGTGPFQPSDVPNVPTIFDRLEAAGDTWKIYGAPPPSTQGGQSDGYIFSICPTFASCLYTPEVNNLVPTANVLDDAAAGTLPSYSVLTPSWSSMAANGNADTSQHNQQSMLAGDNWIAKVVSAIESGPDWNSTAVFITYDDCGCFYDHVAPPLNPDGSRQGPRLPMVIVSPYAIPRSTDSTNATFASVLAFTEHAFGLAPLAANDAAAYDYANSFNFTQAPLPGIPLPQHVLPSSTLEYLETHRTAGEDDVS